MIKIITQLFMVLMILKTINIIKKNEIKLRIENYIISIVIYTIVIMLLF